MTSKKLWTLAAAVAAGMPLAASAAPATEWTGFYVGAGVGSAKYESADFVDCFGECDTFSDSDIAYNVFVGWQVTQAVAVEVGYHDWGEGEDGVFGENVQVEPSMFTVMAVGRAPVGDNFSIFGKAGVAFLEVDASAVDGGEGGSSSSGSPNSQDLALGGGLEWHLGNFGIRGEALWVDAEDADTAMMYGVSGVLRFGGG
jgi:OOP family OmpA-OmpF porin